MPGILPPDVARRYRKGPPLSLRMSRALMWKVERSLQEVYCRLSLTLAVRVDSTWSEPGSVDPSLFLELKEIYSAQNTSTVPTQI